MTRCTCIYRASTAPERARGAAAISVASRDPWCPAAELHDRTLARDRSAARVDDAESGLEIER